MPLSVEERHGLVEHLRLRFDGGEWKGGCPRCGGHDRFNVTRNGLVWCRGCGSEPGFYQAVMRTVDEAGVGQKRTPYIPPVVTATGNGKFVGTRGVANSLWNAGKPADETLAHVYLSKHRHVWPPADVGVRLPKSVRWIDASAMRKAGCKGVPQWAAGAMLCCYENGAGETTAVSLEVLDDAGQKGVGKNRWRRTYGSRSHSSFIAQIDTRSRRADAFKVDVVGDWDAVVVAEGEVTALACALKRPGAKVLCAGGTSNMLRTADMAFESASGKTAVVIEIDGDEPGRKAGAKIVEAHPHANVVKSPDGQDVADVLANSIEEEVERIGGDESTAWKTVIERHNQEARSEPHIPQQGIAR